MAKIRVETVEKGMLELFQSKEIQNACKRCADKAMAKLGSGYEMDPYVGKRANVSITPVSRKAKKDNMENNTILKALR